MLERWAAVTMVFILTCLPSSMVADPQLLIPESLIQQITVDYGDFAGKRLKTWVKLVYENKHVSEKQKLELVNTFFNQIEFISDEVHWGEKDYWATPIEFLATNAGDCEDFSIAKYFTLRGLGVSDDRLQLTYVKALSINQAHMVLTYYETPDSEPLVLDNLIAEILPASKRSDLIPVYSFNGEGLWKAKDRNVRQRLGSSNELSRWRELNKRVILGM